MEKKLRLDQVSVVILAKDEADNIRRCLTSVAWCEDIVIIDNSTDNTQAVAQKSLPLRNLRIFKRSESNDFAKLRNFGLTQTKHDWVLFSDADEEVSHELKQEIRKVILESRCNGFFIKRRDYFLGKWLKYGETGNIRLLKFGKKDAGKWERRVHEVWNIKGRIGLLNSPLLHYPHPSISEFVGRINRWTTLDADVFFEQGVRSSFLKIITFPVGKFIKNYFMKLGFWDGIPGLIHALLMSFHSFLTRAKLYILQNSS